MSLRSRLAIAAAAGVLAATAATPAVATDGHGDDPGNGATAYGSSDTYGDHDGDGVSGTAGGNGMTGGVTGGDGYGHGGYGSEEGEGAAYGHGGRPGAAAAAPDGNTAVAPGTASDLAAPGGEALDAQATPGAATPGTAGSATASAVTGAVAGRGGDGDRRAGYYKGVVTASTLALRSAPNRGSQIIRYAHRGDVVSIFCKTGGETVDGNPLWYLLPDGTWAWGAARYIDNIGPAPRWC
ncbi:MAG TPA: SH3 domain-containing protein [Streptomyces sp.]|nr:SH3 domain-containing protein [Streptomyces sp.]